MFDIIYISAFYSIFIIGIGYVAAKREKYEAELPFLIVLIIYFLSEILSFTLFNLSTEQYFNLDIAVVLWKISIFSRIFSIGLFTSIHGVELHKSSRFRYLPIFFFIFIEGLILSLLFDLNSFNIYAINFLYHFDFISILLLGSILFFNILTIIILITSQIRGFKNYNDKKLGVFYYGYIFLLSLNMMFYTIYLVSHNLILKSIYLVSFIVNSAYVFLVIIKKPSLFLVFTNKLYDFIIFHRSGILLYSYNFQTDKEAEDSLLKGSILIGISHILANFSNMESQLSLIKMSDRGVVFNFNNNLGYAILLIAKHKNTTLEKTVNKFMTKFSELNKDNLKNLRGLIDTSVFKKTNELIKDIFRHYIVKPLRWKIL
ncbi:MAG: hypothetical protein ACFE85_00190 [Candidatus Hodarchaeota archaeon]